MDKERIDTSFIPQKIDLSEIELDLSYAESNRITRGIFNVGKYEDIFFTAKERSIFYDVLRLYVVGKNSGKEFTVWYKEISPGDTIISYDLWIEYE